MQIYFQKYFFFLIRNSGIRKEVFHCLFLSESNSDLLWCRMHFHFLFSDYFYHYNTKAKIQNIFFETIFSYILGYIEKRTSRERKLLVLLLSHNSHERLSNPFLNFSEQFIPVLICSFNYKDFPTLNLPRFSLILPLLTLSAINLKSSINILLNFKPAFQRAY